MKPPTSSRILAAAAVGLFIAGAVALGQTATPPAASQPFVNHSDANGNPVRMARATGHISNYDESKVGTYTLPDPLVLADGTPVRDAQTWFTKRRPEILKYYEDDVYGRVPDSAPKVTWEVAQTDPAAMNGTAIMKRVVGHMDPASAKQSFSFTMYTPAKTSGPVPMILCLNFGFGGGGPARGARGAAAGGATTAPAARGAVAARGGAATAPAAARGRGAARGAGGGAGVGGDPIADILARGWGYATVIYTEIQPDSATYTNGAIGLSFAEGQTKPAPGEWGTIAAWAWGASRIVDYFETDKSTDAKQVAIMGHSRLGKTVLVAGARDPRIAVVFSSCGGEMGSALARRDFGETIDDMAQNFPWQFCGNFQKWVGHWNEMPVDTHMIIALNAPHPVFVGGGVTDQWSDPRGEFLGEVAAGPVYRLLGLKDLGTTEFPAVDTPIITGDLGYHYHNEGHASTASDWKAFLEFSSRYLHAPAQAQ